MKEVLKTIFLLFLVALSIFQTGELWSLRDSERNFFTIWATQATGPSYKGYFFVPMRTLTSLGSNRFAVTYAPEPQEVIQTLLPLLQQALQKEPIIAPLDTDIYNQRSIIYYYAFNMPTDILLSYLSLPLGTLPSYMPTFSHIVLSPSEQNYTYIHLVNPYTSASFTVENGLTLTIDNLIQTATRYRNDEDIHYISTDIMGFTLSQNMFVPRWRGGFLSYPLIYAYEPPLDLSVFFANPATTWQGTRDGATIYGDFNIIVSHYSNILEYTSNRQGTATQTLLQDFNTAMEFLNKDTNINNQLILTSYSTGGGASTFYFNHVVNNLPVFVEELTTTQGKPLNHWLQITIENGEILNYTRVTKNLYLTASIATKEQDIINLVDTYGQGVLPTFGYLYRGADRVYLHWRDWRAQ